MKQTISNQSTFCVLAYLFLTLVSNSVQANRSAGFGDVVLSEGAWTQIASACTKDETSINPVLIGAGVIFPNTEFGTITLRCNITNVMSANAPWNAMEVSYRDQDGAGASGGVSVSLHKVSVNGISETRIATLVPGNGLQGATLTDPSLIATFDSDKIATAVNTTQTHSVAVNHTFDFGTNAYYVLIKVKRQGTVINPAAFIVRLFDKINIGG
jgi:hypothetical protein